MYHSRIEPIRNNYHCDDFRSVKVKAIPSASQLRVGLWSLNHISLCNWCLNPHTIINKAPCVVKVEFLFFDPAWTIQYIKRHDVFMAYYCSAVHSSWYSVSASTQNIHITTLFLQRHIIKPFMKNEPR